MEVEVIEIYPFPPKEPRKPKIKIPDKLKAKSTEPPKPPKYKEAGTVHVYIKDWDIDIKSIMYLVKQNGKVKAFMPGKMYVVEKKKVAVPLINFRNKELRKQILQLVCEEVKKTLS